MKYALDFDHRDDNGPRLVGPFDTKDEAHKYASQIRECTYVVATLEPA